MSRSSRSPRTSGSPSSCLKNWLRRPTSTTGVRAGSTSSGESASCVRLRQPDPAARAGERGPAPGGGVSVAGEPAGKMMYPLVRELAADGIPVTVTCRVLKLARQPYYRWLASPVTDAELDRGLPGERAVRRPPRRPGVRLPVPGRRGPRRRRADGRADRVADLLGQRLVECVRQASAARTARAGPAGPRRPGAAGTSPPTRRTSCGWPTSPSTAPARASSTSARSRTCYSNRIVGYSIDSRMKSRLAVAALEQRRRTRAVTSPAACCTPTAGRNFAVQKVRPRPEPPRHGRIDGPRRRRRRQRGHGVLLRAAAEERPRPPPLGHPRASCGSRSSPGSNGPTTAVAGRPLSAD